MARSKRKCQKIHARRRFAQRTGLIFGPKLEQYFLDQIRQEKAVLIERQSARVAIYEIEYEGKKYRVVNDKKRKSIVTVLPDKEAG